MEKNIDQFLAAAAGIDAAFIALAALIALTIALYARHFRKAIAANVGQ